jgi:hypothetical protein
VKAWQPWPIGDAFGLAGYVVRGVDGMLPGIGRHELAAGPGGLLAVARAAYDLLVEQRISYDLDSYHPSDGLQEIRTPAEVLLGPRRATCLDAALVYAGLLIAYDLLPVVVVLDGHALTLVSRRYGRREWNTRAGSDRFRDGPVTDPAVIRSLVRSGDFAAVECTGFTRVLNDPSGALHPAARADGFLTFDQALDAGFQAVTANAPPLRFAVDVATAWYVWRTEARQFQLPPPALSAAEIDQWVFPHEDVMRDLRNRPRHLLSSQLGFVSPGAEHPAAPANILRRLAAATDHGVLLTGPAGAGKTRTCIEVAILADREGWRVLHVRADSRLTNEHLEAAVLRNPAARTLLVLDYLDYCGSLDIAQFVARMMPRVANESGQLAILGSVRPSRLGILVGRSAQEVFDKVPLRQDDEHQETVAARILRKVARKAFDTIGKERLIEICGQLPIITLLIAPDVERSIRNGEPIRPGPDRSRLTRWLHNRLVLDGLIPTQDPAAATPFSEPEPRPVLLACALAAAVCPLPQDAVEALIQPLLDGAPKPVRARVLVDMLLGMDWLRRVGDELNVAHDIVTDQFIVEAIAPPAEVRIRDTELRALLDALVGAPAALDHVAGSMARVHADLASSDKASQLERACAEWMDLHKTALGTAFAASADGGHALYTLLHAAPWQALVSAEWNTIVEPWLREELRDHDRVAFLSYTLRAVPAARAHPIITAALVWCVGHRYSADAELVLTSLLRREDLLEDERERAMEHALSWLETRAESVDATFVLRGLLAQSRNDRGRVRRVITAAVAWLAEQPTAPTADFVLRQLLTQPALRGGLLATVIECALGWTQWYARALRAQYVLSPLLERPELSTAQRAQAVELALRWLEKHGTGEDASYTLRPLLYRIDATPGRRTEILDAADAWLDEHETHPTASFVLRHLLLVGDLPATRAERHARQALRWIDTNQSEIDVSYVLSSLIAQLRPDSGAAPEAVAVALRWLGENPHRPNAGYVLGELARSPVLGAERSVGIAAIAADWLDDHVADTGANYVIRALLENPAHAGRAAEAGLAWLDGHPNDAGASYLIRALLESPTHADRAAEAGLAWLDNHPDDAVASYVIRALLGNAAAAGRAAEAGLAWLRSHSDHPAASNVIRGLLDNPDHADEAAAAGFAWLGNHLDHPVANYVIRGLLGIPAYADRAAAAGFAWLGNHPDDPLTSYLIRDLLENPAYADRAADAGRAWLDGHADDPVANFVIRALLDFPVHADHAAEAGFAWLDHYPDEASTGYLIRALLENLTHADRAADSGLAWLSRHLHDLANKPLFDGLLANPVTASRAARQAFVWLERNPDHPSAGFIIRAVAQSSALPAEQVERAADAAFAWLDRNPGHPEENLLIRSLMTSSGISADQRDWAAHAAFGWLAMNADHHQVNLVIRALVRNHHLDGSRWERAVEAGFAWLDANPGHPDVNRVIRSFLAVRPYESSAADRAVIASLGRLPSHPDPTITRATQQLRRVAHSRSQVAERAAGNAFAWLAANPEDPDVNVMLQALVTNTDLPAPSAGRAAELALSWLEAHPDDVNLIALAQGLLPSRGLTGQGAERVAGLAISWLATHAPPATSGDVAPGASWVDADLDNLPVNVLMQNFLTNPNVPADRIAPVAGRCFAWLAGHPDAQWANRVIQSLLLHEPHAERAAGFAFAWLDEHPDDTASCYVIQALLACPGLRPQLRARAADAAFGWLDTYPDDPGVSFVIQALLACPDLDGDHLDWAGAAAIAWVGRNPYAVNTDALLGALLANRCLDPEYTAVAASTWLDVGRWSTLRGSLLP